MSDAKFLTVEQVIEELQKLPAKAHVKTWDAGFWEDVVGVEILQPEGPEPFVVIC